MRKPGQSELTIADVISDPLIALVNEADGIDQRQFAQIMQSASRVLYHSSCKNCRNRICEQFNPIDLMSPPRHSLGSELLVVFD